MNAATALHRESLLEGDVGSHVRRLAVPLGWGMMAITSFSVIDALFISRLGTEYLAALGFTIPVVMLFMSVIFGLGVGTSSVLSRLYGQGHIDQMRQVGADALTLTVTVTAVAALLGFAFIDPVFRLMGARGDIVPLVHGYMHIWYAGMPFLAVTMVGNSCMRATGDTRFPSRVMIALSVLNIILDPILIFGFGPVPGMKLQGAALALVLSNAVIGVISLYYLICRNRIVGGAILHRGMFASWRKLLHVALPTALSNQVSHISAMIITGMAAGFGTAAVAALGLANRIEAMAMIFFYAAAGGVSIFTGQNFGAGNLGRIREAGRIGLKYACIIGLGLAATFWIMVDTLPLAFDRNPDVLRNTSLYLHWVPISYMMLGAMIICNASMAAMGRPMPVLMVILLKAVVIYIPMAWVLKDMFGFSGILIALTITNFIVGGVAFFWQQHLAK